jgi:predicted nucleic acid-binding protein
LDLTIDSFAWIELIRGSDLGAEVRRGMEAADRCYTPSIVLAEVGARCFRDGMSELRILEKLTAIAESSDVVPIRPRVAAAAGPATEELRAWAKSRHLSTPGLGDGLVLATARSTGSRVLTGDLHFQALRETAWVGHSTTS